MFVIVRLLKRAKQISQYRMLRLTTIVIQRKGKKNCSLYGDYKLFLSKDEFKVVRVKYSIVSILLFRINILLSSKSIWFSAKITRIKPITQVSEIR